MRLLPFFAALLVAAPGLLLPASAAADDTPDTPAAATPPPLPRAPAKPLPPKPASHIIDDLHVLTPELTATLSARLTATARDPGVHVFLLTVPRQKPEEITKLAEDLAKTWIKDLIGAIVIFDDDTGKVTIATSDRVEHDFSSLTVNMFLRDQLLATSRESGLSRDKLVETATEITAEFSKLKRKTDLEEHRQRVNNLIMGAVALLGIGLAVFSALAKPKNPAAAVPRESPPPAES